MTTGLPYRSGRVFYSFSGVAVPELKPERPFLNRDDVAAIGSAVRVAAGFAGVELKPKTISEYLYQSQPQVGARGGQVRAGKYAGDPFPVPDGRIGKAPWWDRGRTAEIEAWFVRHPPRSPGDGIGGRPRSGSA